MGFVCAIFTSLQLGTTQVEHCDCADIGMDGDKPLQLRDVADMLRKSDEPQAVIRGLSLLGPLIEAAPEELTNYSGTPPAWCRKSCDRPNLVRMWLLGS